MSFEYLRESLLFFIHWIRVFATDFVGFMFNPFTISGVEIYPLQFLLGAFVTVTIFKLVFDLFIPSA